LTFFRIAHTAGRDEKKKRCYFPYEEWKNFPLATLDQHDLPSLRCNMQRGDIFVGRGAQS
jgi:hypothetical protein